MKIVFLTLIGFLILSACALVASSTPITQANPTSTELLTTTTPSPTSRPSQTPYPTATEWIKIYPIKKTLVIYGLSGRDDYTMSFAQWGDFSLTPYLILYEDGQLILTSSFLEKQLSPADTQVIVSKLEQLGFTKMEEAYNANPDSLFEGPANLDYSPLFPYVHITFFNDGTAKSIIYRKDQEQYLVQPMKEVIAYLNSITPVGAKPYEPNRLLVSARTITEPPEGESVIPWPEDVPSPLHRSSFGVFYLVGNEALKLYKAAGEARWNFFSFEGQNYEVTLRPILPHECHIYHYSEVNLPPPAQPSFICDNW